MIKQKPQTYNEHWGEHSGVRIVPIYQQIHDKIHELEVLLATEMNKTANYEVLRALEQAHDILVHHVAEWVTTAEKRSATS